MKQFLKSPFTFIVCILLAGLGAGFATGHTPDICPAPHWGIHVSTLACSVTWFGHTGLAGLSFFYLKPGTEKYSPIRIVLSFLGTLFFTGLLASNVLKPLLHMNKVTALLTAFALIVAIGTVDFFTSGKRVEIGGVRPVQNGILQEIWLSLLLSHLVPEGSYLMRSVDLSEYVNYNQLHYTETGDLPTVLVDNTVYPVPYNPRIDNPLQQALHYFNTLGTVVTDAEEKQLSYNKVASVTDEHARALWIELVKYITYNWFPQQNTAYTPVTATTGLLINSSDAYASNSDPNSYAFTPGNLSAQKKIMDDLYVPEKGRVAILCSQHMDDLGALDAVIFKRIMENTSGKPINLYGFDIYTTQTPAIYDAATGQKLAFGAAGDANNRPASLFYYENEMFRAEGDTKMFARLNDPEAMGDIINFGKFFTGGSLRNKYASVVYSGIKS